MYFPLFIQAHLNGPKTFNAESNGPRGSSVITFCGPGAELLPFSVSDQTFSK
jgi:hypothetical protein